VLSGVSLGFVIIGFSNSNVLIDNAYRPYITTVGLSILAIMMVYGMDNVYDFEEHVIERSLVEQTNMLDQKSINNDVNAIKFLMFILVIITFVIAWSMMTNKT
jgi:hypothetical protein|tara:strand:- start:288 stop:596 length:309 start_codon:yes stop_codon:yes gene_type:complete